MSEASRAALLIDLKARMARGEGFALATLNLDHLVKLGRDRAFRDAYAAHTHVSADGRPITWLARLCRQPVDLVTGSDLIAPLVESAAATGTQVALLGATEQALDAAGSALSARYPGLVISARIAPPFGLDPDGPAALDALDHAVGSGAGLVLLALGAPRQERLAAHGLVRYPTTGFVSIGAGLDFIAGSQRRAPGLMRRLGLEWLWRLLAAPRRLGRRYLDCALILPWAAVATIRLNRSRAGGV
ncbi:MAG: WecB/TagA/CpsF family glycosyltransferase [Pseudomonadota bacterium]